MVECRVIRRTLRFAFTARTSRETLRERRAYFVVARDSSRPDVQGVGEATPFASLQPSFSDYVSFESRLARACADPLGELPRDSAIRFGLQTALDDLSHGGRMLPQGDTSWSLGRESIALNALVWMDSVPAMMEAAAARIAGGATVIKLKVGHHRWEDELELLRALRSHWPASQITLKLDANGAFDPATVLQRLDTLARFDIHSIEQPVPRDSAAMPGVCRRSPIDVALDEELIERWWDDDRRGEWLQSLGPRYLVIKPSLCGGFDSADSWIALAQGLGIGWWATSALESNVGLNAIAQWLSARGHVGGRRHGLGTGLIYSNNVDSPIILKDNALHYDKSRSWKLPV